MAREYLSIELAERPVGEIVPGKTFNHKMKPMPSPSSLKDGQILVEVNYLSLDPAMRGWLMDVKSYLPPVKIGAVMRGDCVARVLASKSKLTKAGDFVCCRAGWQQYAVLDERNFDPPSDWPELGAPTDMLSALGLTGVTAWIGMTQIGDPKPGETVVVSGAAGATGSIAGQIAKLKGAHVIGIAGTDDKCKWLVDELGFDAALNYKDADFRKKFKAATPNWVDVYYDNVGGEMLDMALGRAKEFSRFVQCGGISEYNATKPTPFRNMTRITTMRIRMQGFVVFDHAKDFARARADLAQWIKEGKIKKNEYIAKGGLETAEQNLLNLFKGINTGKLLVEIKNPNESSPKL